MKFNILLEIIVQLFDTLYVHNFAPTINSFGPDIDLCVQTDYNLELSNDSTNGLWSLNNEPLPTDSLSGTYFLFLIKSDFTHYYILMLSLLMVVK